MKSAGLPESASTLPAFLEETMYNKKRHFGALELPKVLEMLAHETSCEDSRFLAQQLEPSGDLDTVRLRLQQTEDAFTLLARYGVTLSAV